MLRSVFLAAILVQPLPGGEANAATDHAVPAVAPTHPAAEVALPATFGDDTAKRRQEAARRGLDYLLDRAAEMPPAWRAETFGNFAKIVPTESLAKTCREQFALASRDPIGELPKVYEARLLGRGSQFRSTLRELVRLKRMGAGWREPTRALARLIAEHEELLWEGMQPTQRLVVGYQLGLLGIETEKTADDVIASLRLRWSTEDHKNLLLDSRFMFGVTHVVFVRSGYFDRMLAPANYATEIQILDQAATLYAKQFPDELIFIDIAAEVLTSRRLLGRPESPASASLAQRLLERQNPDGSWGQKGHNRDTHATSTTVQALIDYSRPFRKLTP